VSAGTWDVVVGIVVMVIAVAIPWLVITAIAWTLIGALS
jgi:hypothetical protein